MKTRKRNLLSRKKKQPTIDNNKGLSDTFGSILYFYSAFLNNIKWIKFQNTYFMTIFDT